MADERFEALFQDNADLVRRYIARIRTLIREREIAAAEAAEEQA